MKTSLPMRDKYVDQFAKHLFIFGEQPDGTVDVNDGTDDVLAGVPKEIAEAVVAANQDYREKLYAILCKEMPRAEDIELGKTIERGSRKARVDYNRVPNERKFAVFMHTYYLGRWYYDGYLTVSTVEEGVTKRDAWLNGQT